MPIDIHEKVDGSATPLRTTTSTEEMPKQHVDDPAGVERRQIIQHHTKAALEGMRENTASIQRMSACLSMSNAAARKEFPPSSGRSGFQSSKIPRPTHKLAEIPQDKKEECNTEEKPTHATSEVQTKSTDHGLPDAPHIHKRPRVTFSDTQREEQPVSDGSNKPLPQRKILKPHLNRKPLKKSSMPGHVIPVTRKTTSELSMAMKEDMGGHTEDEFSDARSQPADSDDEWEHVSNADEEWELLVEEGNSVEESG